MKRVVSLVCGSVGVVCLCVGVVLVGRSEIVHTKGDPPSSFISSVLKSSRPHASEVKTPGQGMEIAPEWLWASNEWAQRNITAIPPKKWNFDGLLKALDEVPLRTQQPDLGITVDIFAYEPGDSWVRIN
jgi:hypothetical protein